MACNKTKSLALFIVLNLLFIILSSACSTCPTPKPKPPPKPKPCPPPPAPKTPTPKTPKTPPTMPPPTPSAPPPVPSKATCPKDTLKLGVCGDLLGGLIGITIGTPSKSSCCTLIQGLTDLEAAVCLCTAIKANVLGINLNVPISLSLILSACSKEVPSDFQCS